MPVPILRLQLQCSEVIPREMTFNAGPGERCGKEWIAWYPIHEPVNKHLGGCNIALSNFLSLLSVSLFKRAPPAASRN